MMRHILITPLILSALFINGSGRAAEPLSGKKKVRSIHAKQVHDMKEEAKLPPADYGDLVVHNEVMKFYVKKAAAGRPEKRFLIIKVIEGDGPNGEPNPEVLTNVERLGEGGPEKFGSIVFALNPVDLQWCRNPGGKTFAYRLYQSGDDALARERGVLYYKCLSRPGLRPVMWWGLPAGTRLDDGDPVQNAAKVADLFPEPKKAP